MKIVMPEDGWGERAVDFYCEFCNRTFTSHSVYLNMDALLGMNMTQSEFARELHRNDYHKYDEVTKQWSK